MNGNIIKRGLIIQLGQRNDGTLILKIRIGLAHKET